MLPSGLKRIRLGGSGMNVSIIGNFGVTTQTIDPDFPYTRDWYEYITGDTLNAGSAATIELQPGEFRIYTDVKLETPDLTGINDYKDNITYSYRLSQNYPNPFNPETNITFEIPKVQRVELAVYNILGQEIKVLTDQIFNAGSHTIKWRGVDEAGQKVSSGIYILHITAGDFVQNRKMILIR